ncbi:MAG: hypothetical protein RR338_04425 [Clostridia bacterium]
MAKIIKFENSKKDDLYLARLAQAKGEAEKSILFAKDALEIDENFCPAMLILAQNYSALGVYDVSNSVLLRALAASPSESERNDILSHLAMNYATLDENDVAGYYAAQYDGDNVNFEWETVENPIGGENTAEGYSVVYPKGHDFYWKKITEAAQLIAGGDFDKAYETVRQIPGDSELFEVANHMVLANLIREQNTDGVIKFAEENLKQKDTMSTKCTLVTAYIIANKQAEAEEILNQILQKEYTEPEEIIMLLPMLVNAGKHKEIAKYTGMLLNSCNLQPNILIWQSQAYYNLGETDKAVKIMQRVRRLYGEFTAADYFLGLYLEQPATVGYELFIPIKEKMARYGELEAYLKMNDGDFEIAATADLKFRKIVNWAFEDSPNSVLIPLISRLDNVKSSWVEKLLRKKLLSNGLTFEVMSFIILQLMSVYGEQEIEFVAQDRFKTVSLDFPAKFVKFPQVLLDAVQYSAFDILYTDEEPQFYFDRLIQVVKRLAVEKQDGSIEFLYCPEKWFTKVRSVKTIVGVLLSKVYEDEQDICSDCISRYDLKEKTFEKYYSEIFGVDNILQKEVDDEKEVDDDDTYKD